MEKILNGEELQFPVGQKDVAELRRQIATTLLRESGKLYIKPHPQQVVNENIFDYSGYYLWKLQKIQLPGTQNKSSCPHKCCPLSNTLSFFVTDNLTSASTVERKKQMTVERQSWHGYFMHRMWSCVCIYFTHLLMQVPVFHLPLRRYFQKHSIMGSKQFFFVLPILICLSKFSLNISCSVKMFLHYRYPVMPVDGGFTMHVLEGQRQRTNFYVQHAKGKERKFMYIYKIRHFLLTVYFSFFLIILMFLLMR